MKRHPFDPISFAAGIVFLLIAGTVAFGSRTNLSIEDWLIPASILVLGIGILAASLRGLRGTDSVEATETGGSDNG